MSFHIGSCQLYSDELKFILNCLCQGKLFLVRHRAGRRQAWPSSSHRSSRDRGEATLNAHSSSCLCPAQVNQVPLAPILGSSNWAEGKQQARGRAGLPPALPAWSSSRRGLQLLCLLCLSHQRLAMNSALWSSPGASALLVEGWINYFWDSLSSDSELAVIPWSPWLWRQIMLIRDYQDTRQN